MADFRANLQETILPPELWVPLAWQRACLIVKRQLVRKPLKPDVDMQTLLDNMEERQRQSMSETEERFAIAMFTKLVRTSDDPANVLDREWNDDYKRARYDGMKNILKLLYENAPKEGNYKNRVVAEFIYLVTGDDD